MWKEQYVEMHLVCVETKKERIKIENQCKEQMKECCSLTKQNVELQRQIRKLTEQNNRNSEIMEIFRALSSGQNLDVRWKQLDESPAAGAGSKRHPTTEIEDDRTAKRRNIEELIKRESTDTMYPTIIRKGDGGVDGKLVSCSRCRVWQNPGATGWRFGGSAKFECDKCNPQLDFATSLAKCCDTWMTLEDVSETTQNNCKTHGRRGRVWKCAGVCKKIYCFHCILPCVSISDWPRLNNSLLEKREIENNRPLLCHYSQVKPDNPNRQWQP